MRDSQTYAEATEQPWIAAVPMSHLSIEVGHFSLNDIVDDAEHVEAEFRRIGPLITAFVESARIRFGPGARVSTCYLLDDYFQPATDAAEALTELLAAAERAGLGIDYLARESGCCRSSAFADGVPVGEPIPVADMVAARIVAEPAPPDTGSRPPTAESGWLCNGRRSSEGESAQAMRNRTFRPPEEFGCREHSIFLDVQLWSVRTTEDGTVIRWSCPFLAAVWQLLRLGMLRFHGAPVVDPYQWRSGDPWPKRWHDVPPVVQLNPAAEPFAAYQTLSMLPKRYLGIEHAVRVILDHLDLDDDVIAQIVSCGAAEAVPITVSHKVSERLSHLLLDGS
ncbi:SCO2522 family protein [Nocardia sp. NPDC004068]|uniref:SCO2522 family protein n=1 Tax=Nocardia sp. NPDC004068 TaxID=3364303 RepID=UPI0036AC0D19